jgi:hypothetical protein
MTRRLLLAVLMVGFAARALAQAAPARPPLPDMPSVAAALGVTCDYCHGGGRGAPPRTTASGKPRLDVAREMIAMTHALNATVQAAAGKTAREAAGVTCATCHRGVAIPRPLTEILLLTSLRDGADAAVAQYRELRTQHYGRGAYDFGEETLLNASRRLGQARPELAIPLADLNLEFFPKSVNTLVVKAIAQSRRDEEAAVATLKQALEIEPNNGEIKGRLYQIEETLARRKRLANPQ